MRVQSILSSFVIILGNAALHLTLAILAGTIELPQQDEMDALLATGIEQGDYECVSTADLSGALKAMKNVHIVALCVMVYIELHVPIWSRIVAFCKANKACCYRNTPIRELKKNDVETPPPAASATKSQTQS